MAQKAASAVGPQGAGFTVLRHVRHLQPCACILDTTETLWINWRMASVHLKFFPQ